MYALQNEINVVADKLYLFPCSKSVLRVIVWASFIDADQATWRWRSVVISGDLQRKMLCFSVSVSRSRVPSVNISDSVYGAAGSGAASCDASRFNYVGQ